MNNNATLALITAIIVVVVVCVGTLLLLTGRANRNRLNLIALDRQFGMPAYVPPPPRRRGFLAVLVGQWWAYMPMLALAVLAYWRLGPGFEMWVMLGGAIFWLVTGAAEDMNSY